MKTNYQNQSFTDIIFENRNKAYGAYQLRQAYPAHMQRALATSIGMVLLLLLIHFARQRFHPEESYVAGPDVVISTTELEIPKEVQVPPAEPASTSPAARQSIENTTRRVIADNQATDSVPTNQTLMLYESGTTTNPDGGALGVDGGTGTALIADVPPAPPVVSNAPVRIAEVMPAFPGGEKALMKFLAKHTQYPERERSLEIEGKVFAEFTVNEDGTVSDIKVLKSPTSGFEREVIRVVKMLPRFSPGLQQNKPVKVRHVLPFTFRLNN